jgi:hypothetical protein
MTTCISEPVSYFRLERYGLRELPAEEDRRVAEHLAQCPICRACYERLQADGREREVAALLAELGHAAQPKAAGRARSWLWGSGALVGCVAVLLFVLRPQPSPQPVATAPATAKGAGLALELTRMDTQGQMLDPTWFAPSDRWKLSLSCPPALSGKVRVLVFQAGEAFEPMPPQALESCGNRRALSGAFQLDGKVPVDVCVVLQTADQTADHLDLTTARSPDALPEPYVCARVEPTAGMP